MIRRAAVFLSLLALAVRFDRRKPAPKPQPPVRRGWRFVLLALAALALVPGAVRLATRMPAFGAHPLPYGDAVVAVVPPARHVTNMVSAINFDLRGFDTLGEEFMLMAAVSGAGMLLRTGRGEAATEHPDTSPGRPLPPRSAVVARLSRLFAPLTAAFGIYVCLHAQLTPGGGFQGGVIIASAALLLWLGDGWKAWQHLMGRDALDAIEGIGAGLYAAAGLATLAAGAAALQNILPLAKQGSILSGGLIPVLNAGVALAVTGGFSMLFVEFIKETRAPPERVRKAKAGSRGGPRGKAPWPPFP